MHRGAALRFDLHAVIGTIIDTALGIFADGGQRHVGPAVHLVMAHDRKLVQINVLSHFDVFFNRRRLCIDDNGRNTMLLHLQTGLGHLRASGFLGQP